MTGTGTIGTRQQVERWIEESQYLLGRVIPSVFDDNQRLAMIIGMVQRVDEVAPVGFEKLAGVVHASLLFGDPSP